MKTGAPASRCAPRGRCEDILVLLEGEDRDRSDFMTRLRCSRMTSQDVKERKSQVLSESSPSEALPPEDRRFESFEICHYNELNEEWQQRVQKLPPSMQTLELGSLFRR